MNEMVSRSYMRRGNFGGKGRPLWSIGTFCRELCRNSWTDWFGVWVVDSGGLKKAWLQSYSPDGANVQNFNCIFARWCQCTWLYSAISCAKMAEPINLPFGLWSGWAEEAQVQSYSLVGASMPTWEGMLAQPGEYDWTNRLQRRCGLVSNCFDHLLSLLLLSLSAIWCQWYHYPCCVGWYQLIMCLSAGYRQFCAEAGGVDWDPVIRSELFTLLFVEILHSVCV